MKSDILKLRELTGAGVMDCRKALEEVGGDFDKAVAVVRERGAIKAEKRESRSTGAGLLETYVHNERIGVLLELRCETDFVSRNEVFKKLARELAMQIAAADPADVESLLKSPYIKDEEIIVGDLLKREIARLGENIKIERFCRFEI